MGHGRVTVLSSNINNIYSVTNFMEDDESKWIIALRYKPPSKSVKSGLVMSQLDSTLKQRVRDFVDDGDYTIEGDTIITVRIQTATNRLTCSHNVFLKVIDLLIEKPHTVPELVEATGIKDMAMRLHLRYLWQMRKQMSALEMSRERNSAQHFVYSIRVKSTLPTLFMVQMDPIELDIKNSTPVVGQLMLKTIVREVKE